MSTENSQTDSANKSCKLCIQEIPVSALVCHHCGQHQTFLIRHMHHGGLFIAIIMMIIGYANFRDARNERIDAKIALDKAKIIEKRINDSGVVLSKALLTLSRFDATFGSLEIMPYSAPYLKKQADALVDILDVTPQQRKEIYHHYEISGRIFEVFDNQVEKQKLFEELKSILTEKD